jgi:hypothetical protein
VAENLLNKHGERESEVKREKREDEKIFLTQMYTDTMQIDADKSSRPAVEDTHTRATCSACGAIAEQNRIPIPFRKLIPSAVICVHPC